MVFPDSVNVRVFLNILKTRLIDNYLIELREGLRASSSLTVFKELNKTFELATYLNVLCNDRYELLSPNCDSRHIHWLLKLEGTPACPEARENVRFVDQMKLRMTIILSLVVRFITKSEKCIFQNII